MLSEFTSVCLYECRVTMNAPLVRVSLVCITHNRHIFTIRNYLDI